MSQAKVDKYKEEKKNRKKIMAKEKRQRVAAYIARLCSCCGHRWMGRIFRIPCI